MNMNMCGCVRFLIVLYATSTQSTAAVTTMPKNIAIRPTESRYGSCATDFNAPKFLQKKKTQTDMHKQTPTHPARDRNLLKNELNKILHNLVLQTFFLKIWGPWRRSGQFGCARAHARE